MLLDGKRAVNSRAVKGIGAAGAERLARNGAPLEGRCASATTTDEVLSGLHIKSDSIGTRIDQLSDGCRAKVVSFSLEHPIRGLDSPGYPAAACSGES